MATSLEEKALYVKALYQQGLKFGAWSQERTKFHTESFWLFSNWFRPQHEPYQPFHKEWMEIACGQQFFGVLAPRDHSKSTTFGANYPIWRLFMQPDATIMLVASAASVAELQMRVIKETIETNELLRTYFGNLYPSTPTKWTNTEIVVERPAGIAHPSVVALGQGAAILSRRAKFVIADDIVRDDEVQLESQRERLAAWVNGVLIGVLEPSDQIGFIGTKKHEWDFYAQLEVNKKYFYRRYDAIQKENQDGTWDTLWPGKWPDKSLKERYDLLGSYEFNRNYRNIAMGQGDSPFPAKWFDKCKDWTLDLTWEYPYNDIKKVISIDLSMNAHNKGSSGSYFVAMVIGLMQDNRYVLLNMIRRKDLDFIQQVKEVSELIEKFSPDAVVVETNAYQRAMYDTLVLKYPTVNIESHVTGRNKNSPEEGIPILQPIIESGRMRFPYSNPNAQAISDVIIEELNRVSVTRYTDCVPAGALIQTKQGYKPIESINIGDEVLTHLNRWRQVTNVGSRWATDVYKLTAIGLPDVLLTGNHRFLVRKREKEYIRDTGSRQLETVHRDSEWICLDDNKQITDYCTLSPVDKTITDLSVLDLMHYAPANWIEKNGRLFGQIGRRKNIIPKTINGQPYNGMERYLSVDKDFLRLMGYHLAEGSAGHHSINWASHSREQSIRRWLMDYLNRIGLNPKEYKTSENGYSVSVSSALMTNYFREFGYKEHKRLPEWIMQLPPKKQMYVLEGYLLGDGCFTQHGQVRVATISPYIAFQIRLIALRNGFACGLRNRVGQNGHKNQWILSFAGTTQVDIISAMDVELLKSKNVGSSDRTIDRKNIMWIDEHLAHRITKIEQVQEQTVYNLSVDEDESYTANGMIVHNCVMAMWFGVKWLAQYIKTTNRKPRAAIL